VKEEMVKEDNSVKDLEVEEEEEAVEEVEEEVEDVVEEEEEKVEEEDSRKSGNQLLNLVDWLNPEK